MSVEGKRDPGLAVAGTAEVAGLVRDVSQHYLKALVRLARRLGGPPRGEVRELTWLCRLSAPQRVPYERLGVAFAWHYSLANLAKVALTLRVSGATAFPDLRHRPAVVVDLGAGCGASALAIVDFFLMSSLGPGCTRVVLHCVDQSADNLALLEAITESYIWRRFGGRCHVVVHHTDVVSFLERAPGDTDCLVQSNLLHELYPGYRERYWALLLKTASLPGCSIAVIERMAKGGLSRQARVLRVPLRRHLVCFPYSVRTAITENWPAQALPKSDMTVSGFVASRTSG